MWPSDLSGPMFWSMMAGNFRLLISGICLEAPWMIKSGDMKISMPLLELIIRFKVLDNILQAFDKIIQSF
jgi:hypothetical protein